MVQTFKAAARRAVEAGFDAIELHGAHGYLIHQFLSPYTNTRTDRYGKDRTLFAKEVIRAVKSVIPDSMPLLMRISATEYVDGGYDIEEAIRFSQILKDEGVDVFDVSSGGEGPIGSRGLPGSHAGYQTPLAKQIKQALSVPVIAVGRLENPVLANAVIGNEEADLVAVGRGLLANPYWALGAASELQLPVEAPTQYKAGF